MEFLTNWSKPICSFAGKVDSEGGAKKALRFQEGHPLHLDMRAAGARLSSVQLGSASPPDPDKTTRVAAISYRTKGNLQGFRVIGCGRAWACRGCRKCLHLRHSRHRV